jgi:hypothetical protein
MGSNPALFRSTTMKSVTVYESADGSRWNTPEACKKREWDIVLVAEAMLPLGEQRSLESHEYIQHRGEVCLRVKRTLIEIAKNSYPPKDYPIFQNDADAIHPCSGAGRIITDSDGPLARAWCRLMTINWENFREYQQCYFAMNPDKVPPAP